MANKVNFAQAISLGFKNYARFRGVASRSEYWYFVLFSFLLALVLSTIDSVLSDVVGLELWLGLNDIANLALFLPSLALVVRRFRDAGISGWWVASSALPAALIIAGVISAVANPAFQNLISWASDNPDATDIQIQAQAESMVSQIDPAGVLLVLLGLLLMLGYVIFELVVKVQPTKTRDQGNQYAPAIESPGATHSTGPTEY